MALALSSTAIVLQTISEKGLTQTNGGRSALSVLLTQDVAVIPMLVLIPLLAVTSPADGSLARKAESHADSEAVAAQVLIETLPAWGVPIVMVGAILLIILGGHYLVRPLYKYFAMAGLMEISTAATLFVVAAAALLMTAVGLSPALGTFLAGVVLASSEFRHEMESQIEPFKGLLLGLFFISVGAGIDFLVLYADLLLILLLSLGVIAVKFGILFALTLGFGIRGRDRWLFALGLAQAGEFGFVLVGLMLQTGVVPYEVSELIMLVVTMSMILTPALFLGFDYLSKRYVRGFSGGLSDEIGDKGPVIIAGVGRFGQVVNRMAISSGYTTTVIDSDMRAIESLRNSGFKGFLGDPTRPELLRAAGINSAEVLVVAVDAAEQATQLVTYARRIRPDLRIVARARDRRHVFELYQAGATDIIRETLDSSLRAGRYVLQAMGLPEDEARQRANAFFRYDQKATIELAAVWDPSTPASENRAYMQRSHDLKRELEANLTTESEELPAPDGSQAFDELAESLRRDSRDSDTRGTRAESSKEDRNSDAGETRSSPPEGTS